MYLGYQLPNYAGISASSIAEVAIERISSATEDYVRSLIPPIKPVVKGIPFYNWRKNYWKYKQNSLAWDIARDNIANLLREQQDEMCQMSDNAQRLLSEQTS